MHLVKLDRTEGGTIYVVPEHLVAAWAVGDTDVALQFAGVSNPILVSGELEETLLAFAKGAPKPPARPAGTKRPPGASRN